MRGDMVAISERSVRDTLCKYPAGTVLTVSQIADDLGVTTSNERSHVNKRLQNLRRFGLVGYIKPTHTREESRWVVLE